MNRSMDNDDSTARLESPETLEGSAIRPGSQWINQDEAAPAVMVSVHVYDTAGRA
jgi:hypothetical protein